MNSFQQICLIDRFGISHQKFQGNVRPNGFIYTCDTLRHSQFTGIAAKPELPLRMTSQEIATASNDVKMKN